MAQPLNNKFRDMSHDTMSREVSRESVFQHPFLPSRDILSDTMSRDMSRAPISNSRFCHLPTLLPTQCREKCRDNQFQTSIFTLSRQLSRHNVSINVPITDFQTANFIVSGHFGCHDVTIIYFYICFLLYRDSYRDILDVPMLTVGFQAYKAATENPVKAIKSE